MTLARRLLIGGGGSFPTPVALSAFEILAAPYGAWPSWTHAFYNTVTGSSLFGFVSDAGSVRIGEYVHATGVGSSTQIGVLAGDQHNAPAILRRSSDGRYVAPMTDHATGPMYVNISTNPDDNSSWSGTFHIEDELGISAYTYPFVCQLGDEAGDPIYLFCRTNAGGGSTNQWNYSKSTSGGADGSWDALTPLVVGTNYYARFVKSSESRIDMAITSGSVPLDHASVYHAYFEGGAWYGTDGTALGGSPPYSITDFTLVYDGSTEGARIPNSIQKLGSRIAIACPTFTGTGTTGDYRIHDWNGSAWSTTNLATNVGMAAVAFGEGGLSLDPADLDHAAASIKVSGTWRMHDCHRSGGVWTNRQITFAGDEDRYPWFVIDHAAGLEFIWQKGTFTTEDIFDVGVWGYG